MVATPIWVNLQQSFLSKFPVKVSLLAVQSEWDCIVYPYPSSHTLLMRTSVRRMVRARSRALRHSLTADFVKLFAPEVALAIAARSEVSSQCKHQ